jgi:hypothetical protein
MGYAYFSRVTPPTIASIIFSSEVLWAYASQAVLFDAPPNAIQISGAILILVASALSLSNLSCDVTAWCFQRKAPNGTEIVVETEPLCLSSGQQPRYHTL